MLKNEKKINFEIICLLTSNTFYIFLMEHRVEFHPRSTRVKLHKLTSQWPLHLYFHGQLESWKLGLKTLKNSDLFWTFSVIQSDPGHNYEFFGVFFFRINNDCSPEIKHNFYNFGKVVPRWFICRIWIWNWRREESGIWNLFSGLSHGGWSD